MMMRWMPMTAVLMVAAPALAQAPAAATTPSASTAMTPAKMPPGYLAGKPPVDILKLLPAPPAAGSAQDIADRTAYAASAKGIGGADWKAATAEINPTSPEFMAALSCAVGTKLSLQATPATMAMVARAGVDLIGPMTVAKQHYARPRPFTTDKGQACDPVAADGVGARLGWSYPSGHSGIGWLWALVLSDAAPARAPAIRSFGQATGDLRIACRVHWLSDVENGRILATTVYQRIAAEPEYQADRERAAAELAKAPRLDCAGR
ncbi:phosphatase PAP2 family protein [Polymorphobacter fuscus]|nr:phosphatase PAP2 family protein [Polymorphobacter fuscus]